MESFGELLYLKLYRRQDGERVALVAYMEEDDARQALRSLNGQLLEDQALRIRISYEQTFQPQSNAVIYDSYSNFSDSDEDDEDLNFDDQESEDTDWSDDTDFE